MKPGVMFAFSISLKNDDDLVLNLSMDALALSGSFNIANCSSVKPSLSSLFFYLILVLIKYLQLILSN